MMKAMRQRTVTAAEARRQLSALLSRVASRREAIVIELRGKPVAQLVPIDRPAKGHLADARGWLDDSDPFFAIMDEIVAERHAGHPRGRRPAGPPG